MRRPLHHEMFPTPTFIESYIVAGIPSPILNISLPPLGHGSVRFDTGIGRSTTVSWGEGWQPPILISPACLTWPART